ncbi:MAG TPA: CbiX/SirB N-terminal domain-containing protein, partial [Ramlibacter sp.]|nr:CbiX/SirB N-terminal domain-containing protein [Ramlibacter sp.]
MTRAIILFGHGSRDPLWRLPMETVATRLRHLQPSTPVRCAFLELEAPTLADAVADVV